MKPKHERPHSVPFKINNIKSEHETRCQLKFKNKTKPPKYQRAKKEEETIPDGQEVKSDLDNFTEQRNKDSERDSARQKQERQQRQQKQNPTQPDPEKAMKERKRKQRQEVYKKGREMGYSKRAIDDDPHVYGKILKEIIYDQGGGETLENGIGFRDGSALFFAPNLSGEEMTATRKHAAQQRKERANRKR